MGCAEWGTGREGDGGQRAKWVRRDAGGGTDVSGVQQGSGQHLPLPSSFLPPSGVSMGSQWVQGEEPWLLAHATPM